MTYVATAFGVPFPPQEALAEETVDVEISAAGVWYSVNDGFRYRATPETLKSSDVSLNRITASSPFYDGEYVVHSTKGNVTETVEVRVYGADNIEVGDNVETLVKWFSQPSFKLRRTLGADQVTWDCYAAEYAIDRSHIYLHNRMALVRFSIPRLPFETRTVLT